MTLRFSFVVEGHGEREAVPLLVRRVVGEIAPRVAVETGRPVRTPKGKLLKPGELERAVELAGGDA